MAFNQNFHILLTLLLLATAAAAQNCSCAINTNLCCNQFGYCGTSNAYCGNTCIVGACYPSNSSSTVSLIVTNAFFNGITDQAAASCAGKTFYTRSAFLTAAQSYPAFGTTGSPDVQKREIAAFFAHVTYETGYFCYKEEINGASNVLCDGSSTQWPCNPNKKYYGRGPLMISWNFNYGPAGQSIGFDGLNSPETVANDPVISFKTAFWFWMNNVHSIITSGQGFGPTIRAISSLECNTPAMNARTKLYTGYCQQLGVAPGDNLSC